MSNTYFYHPDHLGSTSLVTNSYGEITQNISYIPYGEIFVEETAGGWQSPYYFNAKELDEETGLYYYGARYLDPAGARWISVDPLFEKYMGMSPYNYCAGNPVKLVDPKGNDLGVLVDGEAYAYNPNVKKNEYKGHNAAIRNFVKTLNKINSTSMGNKMLRSLHNSQRKYTITNKTSASGTRATVEVKKNGVCAGAINKMGKSYTLLDLAHELFHSYQFEKGQGGRSIWNEVEAYTFSNRLVKNYNENLPENAPLSDFESGDGFEFAKDDRSLSSNERGKYENACVDLLEGERFSKKSFDDARSCFRNVSQMNMGGKYSTQYPWELPTNTQHLLKDFYKK